MTSGEYISGRLMIEDSIDRDKWHIRNSYGNEVARIERLPDRDGVLVLWGPLLGKCELFHSDHDALKWLRKHIRQVEFGEADG